MSSHRIIPRLVRLRNVRSKAGSLASLVVRFCPTGPGLFPLAQHSNPGRAAPNADRMEFADTANTASEYQSATIEPRGSTRTNASISQESLRNWQILIAPTRVCWSAGYGNQLSGESSRSPTHYISSRPQLLPQPLRGCGRKALQAVFRSMEGVRLPLRSVRTAPRAVVASRNENR